MNPPNSNLTCTPDFDHDAQLMIRLQNGDAESFSVLLNRNRNYVLQCLSRMVRNKDDAQDLAQDVFIRVYRARSSYQPTARFSTWLYRIAMNVALNHFRDEKRMQDSLSLDVPEGVRVQRKAADRSLSTEDRLIRKELVLGVRRAIRTLPPKQRAVVMMQRYEEMDYAGISAVLGTTAAAVKAMMFRANKTLRIQLRHLNVREQQNEW